MASIVLSAAGSAIGGAVGGPLGSAFGSRIAGFLGGVIDNQILGGSGAHREGARLEDLAVQTSTYGKMIPLVYGTARMAGNIIWARPITEVAETTESSAGGKAGGGRSASRTDYSYYASFAVAICEGPVNDVLRIWADSKLLDLSQGTYRIYVGDEEQLPDSFIESFEGVGNTPAYRGLAYVVVEDFPLEAFGNRIPNFTFEVRRKVLQPDWNDTPVEEMVTAMIMIPGSGEFVYDDTIQYKITGEQAGEVYAQQGDRVPINYHNITGEANGLLALDQLAEDCPNVEWIGLVVTWFGDSLDAGDCTILPGVEFQTGAVTTPDSWEVGSFNRGTARQITLIDGYPRYGGTPSDASLLRYIDELKDRGYNIMFYPMFFMDVDDKPWRGRVTGSTGDVADFFTKTNGYNAFITHYANLVDGKVDAFVIGSELIGLTKVNDGASSSRSFPAVDALVSLAATVKGILGSGVKVTYAADWSEYHHTEDGWYNLDPLWASSDIDFVGIDSYFPLTDHPQGDYDIQEIIDGWTSGEGYDWYYSDPERTTQTALTAPYAWKNIAWWWSNTHTNPDAATTGWTPESKKIWFTEYGFPSVDGASNQPNVFYDPDSIESYFPYHSKGRVDNRAQRAAVAATEAKWEGSAMIERKFLWTWDARPFPFWPDLRSVWTDGELWRTGHWVNGKFGVSGLAAIVADLCRRADLTTDDFDVTRLNGLVNGFVLTRQTTVREAIEQLQGAYFFDSKESDNRLVFLHRGGETAATVPAETLASNVTVTRAQELELPQQVSVIYLNRAELYQPGHQLAQRMNTESEDRVTLGFPIVMDASQAQAIAEISLYTGWMSRTRFNLALPPQYLALEPTDVIEVDDGEATHSLRITRTRLEAGNRLLIEGVAEDASVYDFAPQLASNPVLTLPDAVPQTQLQLLDIPALPGDDPAQPPLRLAANPLQSGWRGAVIYRSADEGANYNRIATLTEAATAGKALTALGSANPAYWDESGSVTVLLMGEATLASATEAAVLNGANAALLGDEIIQFKTATLVSSGKYTLSGLLRGRLGSEGAIDSHAAGERFILLDNRLGRDATAGSLIGLERRYKPVTIGATLGSATAQDFTHTGIALKPYAPVHLTGTRDESGNLTLTWIRRARTRADWPDYADLPLLEESERYEVEILDGEDVVRTISATSATASYTADDQTTDFGSPQSSLSVRVYQLSASVGRGYGGSGVV